MTNKYVSAAAAALALSVLSAPWAHAQEGPGTRAAGMGGAFVAVADDASAVYWNPAGLASGPLFNFQIDYGRGERTPGEPSDPDARGLRHSTQFIGMGLPPLGVSYYRLSQVRAVAPSPAVAGDIGREDGGLLARRLTTSNFGLTLLQSVGGGLAVGTTLKLVRGTLANGTVSGASWTEILDRAGDVEGEGRTKADLDVGVMLNTGQLRLGLVARNLRQPNFAPDGVDDPDARLDRQVRLGAAWGASWPGNSPLVVSFDADLTRTPAIDGERRDIAAGAEAWLFQRWLGVRGGWRGSTVGERRPVGTAGLSVAVTHGIYVDAYLGRGDHERTWSVGGRFTY